MPHNQILMLLSDLGMGITLDNDDNSTNGITEDCNNDIAISSHDEHYAPYPNKTTLLLDILDNLPHLRMSGSHMQMILWLLKELGVWNVPTFKAFQKFQAVLRDMCGSEPKLHTSSLGNHFCVNDIHETIARDFTNPEVVLHLHLYPEETEGPISEGLCHFYIEELSQFKDGTYVIPHCWIVWKKELHADCSVNGWHLTETKWAIPASEFKWDYFDICARTGDSQPLKWTDSSHVSDMPNQLRKLIGEDEDLYVYNKHINIYASNGCLPGHLLQQEYFVCFVATSPHASSPEQFAALWDHVNVTEKEPIRCFNAHTKRKCGVILHVPSLPADNLQQSEEASHMGGNANCGCHKCQWGGPHEYTKSDHGYHAAHYVSG
ncbi:hypothetical protein EV421DRAFT_1908579 [Armillaria borealis]|uniref:Uncharacterized protein n=1 Tax=Armillaria borealis TaxID=47425 RepID=A0AA39J3R5_9AGAR|nr:hypothetical protein EV421DRAFT_1908579 [Armillaria borealis]